MLLVDDLLIRPFFSLLQSLRVTALGEMYDIDQIRDDLKENQLLYELGERDAETYRRQERRLRNELELAEGVHEQLSGRVRIKK